MLVTSLCATNYHETMTRHTWQSIQNDIVSRMRFFQNDNLLSSIK